VLAAALAALAVTSLAGAGHGPSDAVNALHLGETNDSTATTIVQTSTGDGLRAFADDPAGGVGLWGSALEGTGVTGDTSSEEPNVYGVAGTLQSLSAGAGSAGVFGESLSENANGPGVRGLHADPSGTAPGVLGQTDSVDAAPPLSGATPRRRHADGRREGVQDRPPARPGR
jgi:hypothetical protein